MKRDFFDSFNDLRYGQPAAGVDSAWEQYKPEATRSEMLDANAYQGDVKNRERIGWTREQYKELWDSEFPEDLLEI